MYIPITLKTTSKGELVVIIFCLIINTHSKLELISCHGEEMITCCEPEHRAGLGEELQEVSRVIVGFSPSVPLARSSAVLSSSAGGYFFGGGMFSTRRTPQRTSCSGKYEVGFVEYGNVLLLSST